ncbi:syntaxin binding protein 1 [Coemansia sp. Benny D160-2]|nr:syntaxin binding protein 1 [Coemansia sp. Benny D160-2]
MESSDSNPHSLIEMLRKKIVDAISSTVAPNKWRVVVVDRPSLKIVSFVLKMHEILEQNVMGNVATDDFQPILEQSGAGHTRYARAHLFFTGALSDSLLSSLRQSPAGPYIKRVEELYIEYNPIESRVFLTIPSEHPFYALYSPHSSDMFYRDLNATADRVLSVIACLGIEPYIRYYCPAQSLAAGNVEYPKIAKEMAEKLQQKLNCYYAHNLNKSTNPHEAPTHSPPSTVIILDRSVDMYAPLLHEFTYQAVVHDLIDLEDGNKYAYEISTLAGETRQASATLSEQTDMLWRQHRHKHLGRVAEELATQFGSMVSKNTGVKAAHTQ